MASKAITYKKVSDRDNETEHIGKKASLSSDLECGIEADEANEADEADDDKQKEQYKIKGEASVEISLLIVLRTLIRAFALLGPDVFLGWLLALASCFLSVALLAESVLFGNVINALSTHTSQVWSIMLTWACFSLAGVLLSIFIGLQADRMAHRRVSVVRLDYYRCALQATPLYSLVEDSGKLYKVMEQGTNSLFWNWLNILRSELTATLFLIILVPLGFFINVEMGLTLLTLCAVYAASSRFVTFRAYKYQSNINKFYQSQATVSSDALSNLPLIQTYDNVGAEVQKLAEINETILENQFPILNYWVIVVMMNQCAKSIAILCIITQGVLLYSKGRITVGEIVTFISFANMVVSRLDQVVNCCRRISEDVPKLKSFFEVIDREPAIRDDLDGWDPEIGDVLGDVSFVDVSFRYEGKSENAVRGVSFEIPRGKTLALVGASGAGKSTTLSLLYRAFDPMAGTIRIDGHDIRHMRLSALRRSIAVVFQETMLLNRSIGDNILVGKLNATIEEMNDASARAQALRFIEKRDEGLGSPVGEKGRNLSGGERQRVAIARAMLKDAPILILDEATSALDSGTEALLSKALDDVTRERTTLVIAHRLSTIRNAHMILVLEDGAVVERGNFEELYYLNGRFTKLVEEQYFWHVEDKKDNSGEGAVYTRYGDCTLEV